MGFGDFQKSQQQVTLKDPFAKFAKGRELKILDDKLYSVLSLYPNTHLLLTDDIELQIENTYGSILGEIEPNNFLNLIANSVEFGGKTFPAQNALQSMVIWQKTEPLRISLPISIHMVTSGKTDVVQPIYELIALTVPRKVGKDRGLVGSLIPPGPNLASILDQIGFDSEKISETVNNLTGSGITFKESKGVVQIQIGEYIHLPSCVITSVTPTFSKELDEDYFPISCTATLDIQTVEVVTEDMIQNLLTSLKVKPQTTEIPEKKPLMRAPYGMVGAPPGMTEMK